MLVRMALVGLLAISAITPVRAAGIANADRDAFLMVSVNTCSASAAETAKAAGAIYSAVVAGKYCVCLGYRTADLLTGADLEYTHAHAGALPEALKGRVLKEIIPLCRAEAVKDGQ
jgi:hypothetical protein